MRILGIDIGGTGIKGAPVDLDRGTFAEDRLRIPTPVGGQPKDVAEVVAEIVGSFDTEGPVGCTLPAVVHHGVARTAANVDPSWIGTDAQGLFSEQTGRTVIVVNDADAAGIAEMELGAGQGHGGTVVVLTLGTGVGSALFIDGALVPNTEFGHLEIRGKGAESRASERAREIKKLSWEKWALHLDELLDHLERLLSPDLFIIGGGVSKKADRFLPLLSTQAPVVPAELRNDAGIIGAALAARSALGVGR